MQQPSMAYGGQGAPHIVLLAVVVAVMVAVPLLLGDPTAFISDAVSGILGPAGLLLLPVLLLLFIQFLSSGGGSVLSGIFSTGEPDSIHRVGGSPFGVALFVVVLLFLLYYRVSLFGSREDDSGS